MKVLHTIAALLLFAGPVSAHDSDQMGRLTGDKISVHYCDHAMSGEINGKLIYASPLIAEYGVKLVHRSEGKDVESIFKNAQGKLGGEIQGTEIKFTKIVPKEGLVEGVLDATPFSVRISANAVEQGHYVDPRFDVTFPDRTYTFHLENGKACTGCAVKILYVVLGMLRTTQAL